MIEYQLIKSLLKKETYARYHSFVRNSSSRDLDRIFHSLRMMHEKSDREQFSTTDLELLFYSEYPALKDAEKDKMAIIFKRISESDADESLVHEYLKTMRDKELSRQIASTALEVSEGRKDASSLLALTSQLEEDLPIEEEIKFVTSSLRELYDQHAAKPGLRWRLQSLNESLGSLRKGDFGFLFARPETGKTSFLADQISFMASQAEGPIIWCNNEEQGEKVMRRIYAATFGKTEKEIFSDIEKYEKQFDEITGNNIKLIDDASLSKSYLEQVFKKMQPSLIVFDQIDKIKGFDADRNDLMLGGIYRWAREIAKTYCPVISVCQADGTGEGVKWLTMGHVADAKTSKQAEADWILGIGKSNDAGFDAIRYLNISKNKLTGDVDSLPEMRHGRFEVLIKPEVCRYEDIVYD